mgnify:CR=1 FL=1
MWVCKTSISKKLNALVSGKTSRTTPNLSSFNLASISRDGLSLTSSIFFCFSSREQQEDEALERARQQQQAEQEKQSQKRKMERMREQERRRREAVSGNCVYCFGVYNF